MDDENLFQAVIGALGVGADHNLRHHLPMNFEDPEHTAGLGSAHHVRYFKAAAQSPNQALEYIIKTGIFGADADVSMLASHEVWVQLIEWQLHISVIV